MLSHTYTLTSNFRKLQSATGPSSVVRIILGKEEVKISPPAPLSSVSSPNDYVVHGGRRSAVAAIEGADTPILTSTLDTLDDEIYESVEAKDSISKTKDSAVDIDSFYSTVPYSALVGSCKEVE